MLEEMLQSKPTTVKLERSMTEVTSVPKTEASLEQHKSVVQVKQTVVSQHEEVNEFDAQEVVEEAEENYRSDDNEIRMNFHGSSESSDQKNENDTSIKPYNQKAKKNQAEEDIIAKATELLR